MRQKKIQNLFKNLLALILGLIVAILILELFLQFCNPLGFRQKGNKIVLPSNEVKTFENTEIKGLDSVIQHTKNSLGFRGSERPPEIDNLTSIIAVGGSTTECFFISDGKEWVALLSKKLASIHDEFWINNAGLDGHSTFGHQILLEDFLIKLKPNYLIFLVGCNDIGREDLNQYDKLKLKPDDSWEMYIRNNSGIFSLFMNIRRSLLAKKERLWHSGVDFRKLELLDSIPGKKINQMLKRHEIHATSFESRLKKLTQTCRSNNIVPILMTQPTVAGEGYDDAVNLNLERMKYCDDLGGKAYWKKLELYNDRTRKLSENENILLIDLAEKMPKSTELFYDCVHFTNEGAEAVAQIVFESLKKVFSN